MKTFEVARLFDRMADGLALKSDNPFRIRAYRRAARNLELARARALGVPVLREDQLLALGAERCRQHW